MFPRVIRSNLTLIQWDLTWVGLRGGVESGLMVQELSVRWRGRWVCHFVIWMSGSGEQSCHHHTFAAVEMLFVVIWDSYLYGCYLDSLTGKMSLMRSLCREPPRFPGVLLSPGAMHFLFIPQSTSAQGTPAIVASRAHAAHTSPPHRLQTVPF